MQQLYLQTKKAVPALVRVMALLVFVELAVALLASNIGLHSEQLMLRAVIVLLVAMLTMPFPGFGKGSAWALLAGWGAVSCFSMVAGASLAGTSSVGSPVLWSLGVGVGMLVWLFGGLSLVLAQAGKDRRRAAHWILGGLLASLSLPLWAAPLVARFGADKWLVDMVIALCPASYLAVLADIDYLRSDWFYRHTPFGGLRFDYPDPIYLGLAALLPPIMMLIMVWTRRDQHTQSATEPITTKRTSTEL